MKYGSYAASLDQPARLRAGGNSKREVFKGKKTKKLSQACQCLTTGEKRIGKSFSVPLGILKRLAIGTLKTKIMEQKDTYINSRVTKKCEIGGYS